VRASGERERGGDRDSEAKGGNFWRAEKVGERADKNAAVSSFTVPAACFVSLGNLMGVKRARFLAPQLS